MEDGGVTLRNFVISMNQPLRHGGATLFQSSFGNSREGKDITVLQVVRNPGAWIPYASVLIMSLGLLWHFGSSLFRFLAARAKATATLALLACVLPAQAAETAWDSQVFGEIPVQNAGRVQPIETLANGSLLQMRSRRELALTKLERVAFGQKPSTWTAEQRTDIFQEIPGLKDNQAVLDTLEIRPLPSTGFAQRRRLADRSRLPRPPRPPPTDFPRRQPRGPPDDRTRPGENEVRELG